MSILTLDFECTTYESYKRKSNPFDKRNRIVVTAYKHKDKPGQAIYHGPGETIPPLPLEGITHLVGFNFKFDLLYCWDWPEVKAFFKRGGKIWDCQLAEFLLSGQQEFYPSLNNTCVKYGGTLKNDEIKALWEAGVDTADISKDLLLPYAVADVDNTWLTFVGQITKARELGMSKMITTRMESLLATTEMEWNGLYINKEIAQKQKQELETRYDELTKVLNTNLPELPNEFEFNWGSLYHMSALMFGGTIKYKGIEHKQDEDGNLMYTKKTIKVPMLDENGVQVTYKAGKNAGQLRFKSEKVDDLDKPKLRKCDKFFDLPGITKPNKSWLTKLKSESPIYCTDEDVLKRLKKRNIPMVDTLLEWRMIDKDLGTYYERAGKGMLTLVNGDVIHHKLNHTSTVTTRLSSSCPNAQNISSSERSSIKDVFTSRFGDEGLILESDYSQLEVVTLGVLADDKQLTKDLNAGIDFHCKRLAIKLGLSYDEVYKKYKAEDPEINKLRKAIKTLSFQLQYGAGAKLISSSTGMSIEEVKQVIDIEKKMYPNVFRFNDSVMQLVKETKTPTTKVSKKGHPVSSGYWKSNTNTLFVFTESDSPKFMQDRGEMTSFKPTNTKNAPVQGEAAYYVQIAVGKLWRRFVETNNYGGKALLINTVHDNVVVDVHKSVLDTVVKDTNKYLADIPKYLKELYNFDVKVKFPVDSKVGVSLLRKESYVPKE